MYPGRDMRSFEDGAAVALAAVARGRLAKQVPFDALWCGTTMPMGGMIESIGSLGMSDEQAWQAVLAEYSSPDVNRLADLARRRPPIRLLSDVCGGFERSHRYRSVLQRRGLRYELRMALVHQGVCWGYLVLLRCEGTGEFDPDEVATVRALGAELTQELMSRALRAPLSLLPADRVGVVTIDEGSRGIEAINEYGRELIGRLGCRPWPGAAPLPLALHALLLRTRGGGLPSAPARRVLVVDERLGWLRIDAVRQTGRDGRPWVTVSVQRARPLLVAPYLLAARGVSPGAAKVVLRVLRGMTSAEIAEELRITPHTVQDHLKPVFAKLSINSRRQLIGVLFPQLKPSEVS